MQMNNRSAKIRRILYVAMHLVSPTRYRRLAECVFIVFSGSIFAATAQAIAVNTGSPVGDPSLVGFPKVTSYRPDRPFAMIRNLISDDQIDDSIAKTGKQGLAIDLTFISALLDGREIDSSKIYGRVYSGPYPFESSESKILYRFMGHPALIKAGYTELPVADFFKDRYNSEDWTDTASLSVRFELFLAQDAEDISLGSYETRIRVRKSKRGFRRLPSLTEGPLIHLATSKDPSSLQVSLRTDAPVGVELRLDDGRSFMSNKGLAHNIQVTGLAPSTDYPYQILIHGEPAFPMRTLRTAPKASDQQPIRFAFFADTREGFGEGPGVGDRALMGVNVDMVERLTVLLEQEKPDFLVIGGDLAFGYTSLVEDLRMQFRALKSALVSFWSERPVYTVMGNHDAVVDLYNDGTRHGIRLDRQPYSTESSEAVFASEFINPSNGPVAKDAQRPTYNENVFSFIYGGVKIIVTNTNYWSSNRVSTFGGNPEGYLLDDQMDWIGREVNEAESDPSIKAIVIVGHEPVFPNGGHIHDAMWWGGDNSVRPAKFDPDSGGAIAFGRGIIERRNELIEIMTSSKKVAAFISADEHSFHKLRLTDDVPTHTDPKLNAKVQRPIWFLSSAGGGASYYSEQPTLWNDYWKTCQPNAEIRKPNYYYSSQPHVLLFELDGDSLAMKVVSAYGETIDEIKNLLASDSVTCAQFPRVKKSVEKPK